MNKGLMIALEGNDGAGKTTAINHLKDDLEALGYPVIVTREPGGSPIAEQIRMIILSVDNTAMDPKTEALLYAAARRQHLVDTILPALEEGKIVLCDRFLDSSLAYQGTGRDLGQDVVEEINDFGLEGFRPDLTFFLSVPVDVSMERMEKRGSLNRLDQEKMAFHLKVREGFEHLLNGKRPYAVIDATACEKDVAKELLDKTLAYIKSREEARMDHQDQD